MARTTAHHKHAAKHMEKAEHHHAKAAKHHEMAKEMMAKMHDVKKEVGKLVKSDKKVHAKMEESKAGKKADASKKHHEAESKGMKKYEAKETILSFMRESMGLALTHAISSAKSRAIHALIGEVIAYQEAVANGDATRSAIGKWIAERASDPVTKP